jgi:D-glycero-D-manno-heptose 1,7-bisphosphate phosphatase
MGSGDPIRRAVFLDRDGVINRALVKNGKPYPPADLSELEIVPGAPEALARLRAAGFFLIVVTNQPDVARGRQTREMVEAIHVELKRQLPINDIRVCYHDDADRCNCRKPAPGLLIEAARDAQLNLADCYMVGDRWRDMEAGRRAGCATIFVDYAYAETQPEYFDVKVTSVVEAAEWICSKGQRRAHESS